jgi:hypothetical protein
MPSLVAHVPPYPAKAQPTHSGFQPALLPSAKNTAVLPVK